MHWLADLILVIHFAFILFVVGGLFVGVEETLEKAVAADFLPAHLRGSGFGVLATVNGLGDFASSIMVGFLWQSIHPAFEFFYAGIVSVAGIFVLWKTR